MKLKNNRKDVKMKPMTQTLMIALAILFSIALSLTVSLLCLSFVEHDAKEEIPLPYDTLPLVTLPADTLPPLLPSTEAPTEEPVTVLPDVSNGLRFVSNWDGTCRVADVGSCTDACVVIPSHSPYGDRVTAIDDGAFFGCSTVTAVQIPATVISIGELAFSACENLMYLSVNPQNPAYCDVDGVLYTADLSVLIQYPPMRAGTELTIRVATVTVKEMAFYNCVYLKSILYTGTPQQWEAMAIESKNYSLTAASKTFGVDA